MPQKIRLTREALQSGEIERLLQHGRTGSTQMSDQQRFDLVQSTLQNLGSNNELWVFGYGSLIWNPALDFTEQRRCSIQGFQRRFCFWTTLSRGTIDHPGLMMGLVKGDRCVGVAYRIDLERAATELDILFRREMVNFVYQPTWVETRCVDSDKCFKSLTFVVDPSNDRFANQLSQAETVSTLSTAQGPLGRNCDYLFELTKKLRELDIADPELEELEQLVVKFQESLSE